MYDVCMYARIYLCMCILMMMIVRMEIIIIIIIIIIISAASLQALGQPETYDEVCNEDTNVCVSGVFPVVLILEMRIPMSVYLVCFQLS